MRAACVGGALVFAATVPRAGAYNRGIGMDNIGKIAVVVGTMIAIAAGFFGFTQPWFGWLLAVLGLVVGFMNVTGVESKTFLLAGIGLLMVSSSVDNVPVIGEMLTSFLGYVIAFMAPAILIVALKSLFDTVKD